MGYQDLLDGPFELSRVEPALELTFNCDTVALLLEDLVRQQSVGIDAVIDSHLQAAQHDHDEATGAGTTDHIKVLTRLWW